MAIRYKFVNADQQGKVDLALDRIDHAMKNFAENLPTLVKIRRERLAGDTPAKPRGYLESLPHGVVFQEYRGNKQREYQVGHPVTDLGDIGSAKTISRNRFLELDGYKRLHAAASKEDIFLNVSIEKEGSGLKLKMAAFIDRPYAGSFHAKKLAQSKTAVAGNKAE